MAALFATAPPPARGAPRRDSLPHPPRRDLPGAFLVNVSAPVTAVTHAGLGYVEDSSARGTSNDAKDRAAVGFTYLGQLMTHDLGDLASGSQEARLPPPPPAAGGIFRGPRAPVNRVTFALDLETLHGRQGHPHYAGDRAKLAMGTPTNALD